jgi:SPP1 gp7 family putative phage head morphogenesis protein
MVGTVTPLSKTYPEQTPDKVTTYENSSLWGFGADGRRYNPDDLVGRKGLKIYGDMLNDEQVKAVVDFKLSAIIARGWAFEYDEDSDLNEEERATRTRVFKRVLKNMRGSFQDSLDAIASGREYGFSVTEKVYGDIKLDGKTYRGINKLLTRDPATFEFKADDFGELLSIKQKISGGKQIEVDQDRVIRYVHRPRFDRIFGRSDLRAAYRSWYAKGELVKLWLLFLEKFAGGIAVASRETEEAPAFGSPEYTTLETALRNMASTRSVILPRGVTLEIHFPSTTDAYEKACVFFDLAIAKALLVPNLLGLSHTGQTGAYSQSQTQLEAFFWTLGNDGARIEDCLNEQVFRDLGDQNWGDGEYPEFKFKPSSMEHIKWVIDTWKDLVTANAVVTTEEDEARLRELLDMPVRDEKSTPVVNPATERELDIQEKAIDVGQQQQAANDPAFRAAMAELELFRARVAALEARASTTNVTVNNEQGSPPLPIEQPTQSNAIGDSGGATLHPHGDLGAVPRVVFNRAVERVAFTVIERRTDDSSTVAVNELAAAIARATRRALGDDENMSLLVDADQADIAALEFSASDVGRMKSTAKGALDRAWTIGSNHASNEIERARGITLSTSARAVKFASLRDRASAFFEGKAFRMAGDASDQAKKIIQQELQNAVKSGKPLIEVRTSIWDRLVNKGLSKRDLIRGVETDDAVNAALDELWVDTESEAAAYLDTLIRTNTFEALNEARYAEFTDPELAGFVVGLRYAAVLDSSTTEVCTELDGAEFRVDSEVWDTYRPPNHFNCRSILVPITEVDGWDFEESDEPIVDPQDGFK